MWHSKNVLRPVAHLLMGKYVDHYFPARYTSHVHPFDNFLIVEYLMKQMYPLIAEHVFKELTD